MLLPSRAQWRFWLLWWLDDCCFLACPGGMQPLSFLASPGGQNELPELPETFVPDPPEPEPPDEPVPPVDPVVVPVPEL